MDQLLHDRREEILKVAASHGRLAQSAAPRSFSSLPQGDMLESVT